MVNIDGTPVQRTDYYPYGLPLRQTGASAQPYKFGAKEFDPTNALNSYDFHARQYFPAAIVWQSMDFHAADYPQISPFSYCTANPIIFIDPDGNDRYYFDGVGNFIRAEKEEDYDNVVIQNHGCFEESEPMPYGTIEDVWRWKAANGNYYDYLKVRGDENAKKNFRILCEQPECGIFYVAMWYIRSQGVKLYIHST